MTYPIPSSGTVEEPEGYTSTWYFGKSNGAEAFALESTADYTYTVNSKSIVISTNTTDPRGKLNNTTRTDEWAQCNNNTIFRVPAYEGAKLSWRAYNTGSSTGFDVDGTLYNNYYIATTANETVNMSAVGLGYISYIKIEPVTMLAMTGTVSDAAVNGNTLVFTANGNGEKYTAQITDGAFSVSLPADTYTAQLGDVSGYVVSAPSAITVSSAGSMGQITVAQSVVQTVSGSIANAPAEAFTLTFTGASHSKTINCEASATTFTTQLSPDTYVMSSNKGTLSPLSLMSISVVDAAVSHNIYFTDVIPAATQQDITVDNTATMAANVYNSVSDALAAAKAGNITAPVLTLTSGQTYREQVVVDLADVTLKTSDDEKATITFYYGIGYSYYSLNSDGLYDRDRAMTRNSLLTVNPQRWGATVLVKNSGKGFKAENIIFENSFNQYYTDEEVADGVTATQVGDATITYDRTLRSGQSGYHAADSKAVTERAAALAFENNPTGCELYNCVIRGSQDAFFTSGRLYVKKCSIIGNTDYIFGGGNVVFDDCDLVIGGYSDQEASAYITANNPTQGEYYIFRDCTVKASDRQYIKANLGRDWGGTKAGVYFFNLKNEIGNKLAYKWGNMGGAVNAGTANLHIYDFNPTVNGNYSSTGTNGANVNGLVTDDLATDLYTGVVSRLGFTPTHIYDDMVFDENSAYNTIHAQAYNGGTGSVLLTRSLPAGKWATIVLPFALNAAQITETFGNGTRVAQLTGISEDLLTFSSVTAMTANEPYMIFIPDGLSQTKTISNVTVADGTPAKQLSDITFVGSYAALTDIPASGNSNYYFVSNNNLYQTAASGTANTMKAFRAYFEVPATAAARLTGFVFDDNTTGIKTVHGEGSMVNGSAYYDLQGRRVVQPKKGLYIVRSAEERLQGKNGKKVTIK